jgi:hypothetical protein
MVPFVPDHVLEQQDWMIAVNVHTPACLQPALYRVPHRLRALIQHLSNASRVTLGDPLLVGQLSGELGCILENEHKSDVVDVCEQLCHGRTALHRPDLQPTLGHSAEQVDEDGVVPVPRVEHCPKHALI